MKRSEIGRMGETIASDFLKRKGFKLIERNYRKPWGEIDIIAVKDGHVRFVEVKSISRENISEAVDDYYPEELVDKRKLIKLARTAMLYMESKKDTREFQIDVVGVILDHASRRAKCRLIEQALEDNI